MITATQLPFGLLLLAAIWAGAQNQLAGGGSFITLPALMLTGMDARAANITSTVALFPGQVAGGWMGRAHASGTASLSLRALIGLSLIGGVIGAVLLLLTPSDVFARMVPWLVLFATVAFAWGSFFRKPVAEGEEAKPLGTMAAGTIQLGIAIYGGYFGGGIGFLMLAALALSRVPVRAAASTKNVLAGVMNLTAVLIFLGSGQVHWLAMVVAMVGALSGSWLGAHMLARVNERALRFVVVAIGIALTIALFRVS
ncbi:sulfite exporter TauE/SafE family protein [Novosphingobium sp. FSW06-99]|uniref:sulfite exporter TauE/SafE family protein n=1 Tax=Novosphingobium sp. FSW06-99 TaxID=1739113 RepID=UPI00076BD19A|nr:sulfite exporter TauE/SafE family protein [Novosphingobium sp. FSW06-99]KUR74312.1 transporter [Novosphingobium sp. FSW06-99]